MASILDMMNGIEAAGDRGRMRGQQSKLASLYSQAIGAPREQRTGMLSQIASVSPDAANSASGMFDKMDDNARAELGRYAMAFDALPDEQKAQAYPQLAQRASAMGLPVPQGPYQPQYAQGISQLAQAFGGVSGGQNVQSRFVNERGEVMALLRDGTVISTGQRADPQRWFRDLPGMAPQVVDEFGQVSGVGQPQRAQGEVPFSIDPRLPPEVQAAIRANPDAGSAQGITSLGMGGGGGLGQARPSEAQVAAEQEAAKRGVALQYAPAEAAAEADKQRQIALAKAEAEKQTGEPARQEKVRQVLAKTANISRTIDDAIGRVGGLTTGFLGSLSDTIPGTPANDLRVTVDTIKANLAFDALQAMREASPTGGALGAVSERELGLLEAAVASLDQSQTPDQMRQALTRVKQHYQAWEQAVRESDQEARGQAPQAGGVDDLLNKYGIQ